MDPKVYSILDFLYPHGVSVYQNIAPALLPFYPNVDNKDENTPTYARQIKRITLSMVNDGLIHCPDYALGEGNKTHGYTWLDTAQIRAAITSKGMNTLDEEKEKPLIVRMNELTILTNNSIIATNGSIQETNLSVQRLNRLLKWTNILSVIIAALTGFFIAMTYFKDGAKDQQSTGTQSELKPPQQDTQRKTPLVMKPTPAKKDSTKK